MSDKFVKGRNKGFMSKSVKHSNIVSDDDVTLNLLCKTCKAGNQNKQPEVNQKMKRKLLSKLYKTREKNVESDRCALEIVSDNDINSAFNVSLLFI